MAHNGPVAAQQSGLFTRLVEMLHLDSFAQKIGTNKQVLIDIGLFGTIGLIIGFLFKRYSEYVIVLALFMLGLVVLEQLDLISISINVVALQQMLGLPNIPAITGETYLSLLWEWMKIHVPASISFGVGFLIGLKIG